MQSESSPLGAGVVGGGFMAAAHTRAARSAGARLVGLAASTPESSRRAASALGVTRAFDSAGALIAAPEVEVVHVCTPNSTHVELTLEALSAGKNVICEKPLATSAADALAVTEAATASGLIGTVPFVYRYHPLVREARARIQSGEVGRVLSISGQYLQDWMINQSADNWRVDEATGGPSRAFADIGSHLCDLVEFVSGDRISRLAAATSTVFSSRGQRKEVPTEDLVSAVFQMKSGALGTLLVSQVAPGRKNHLTFEIAGERESLGFDQEAPEFLWIGKQTGSELLLRGGSPLSPDAERISVLPAGHPLGYQDAFNAFVADSYALIRGEEREGVPTFADGLRAATLTEAVLLSAKLGEWVNV